MYYGLVGIAVVMFGFMFYPTATMVYLSPYGQNINLSPGESHTLENLYF